MPVTRMTELNEEPPANRHRDDACEHEHEFAPDAPWRLAALGQFFTCLSDLPCLAEHRRTALDDPDHRDVKDIEADQECALPVRDLSIPSDPCRGRTYRQSEGCVAHHGPVEGKRCHDRPDAKRDKANCHIGPDGVSERDAGSALQGSSDHCGQLLRLGAGEQQREREG